MRYEARRYVISIMIVLLVGVAYAQQAQKVEKNEVTLKDPQNSIQVSDNTNDPKEDKKKADSEEANKEVEAVTETENKEAEAAAAAAEASKSKARSFRATAYCLRGKTASGKRVQRGVIAADPRVLPLGTKVELTAGKYSGEYLVADTGGAVKGSKIDIWVPNCGEARKWGNRKVKLTVLSKPTGRKK